ncbi:MAG: hypothetical protein JNK76_25840, partial [Planctomycetales bacterium]|nr:hypothetical protein [Planctomycetales bacterium]
QGVVRHNGQRYRVSAQRRKSGGDHEVVVLDGATPKKFRVDGRKKFGTWLLRMAVERLAMKG